MPQTNQPAAPGANDRFLPPSFGPLVEHPTDRGRIMFAEPDGRPVIAVCWGGHLHSFTPEQREQIIRRTVICWNAFSDLPTEIIEGLHSDMLGVIADVKKVAQYLAYQRDEMLAALITAREFISTDRNSLHDCSVDNEGRMDPNDAAAVADYDAALAQINAAITKVEGLL